jgi:TolB protein
VSDLYVVRRDGVGERLVTRDVIAPDWAPDGRKFAFMRLACDGDRCGNPGVENAIELFIIHADGSGQRRLTRDGAYQGNPDWSPDGKRLVYETESGIATSEPDGTHVHRLTHRYDTNPAWSPDGKQIVFDTFGALHVLRVEDGRVTRITRDRSPHFAPAWAPDGKRIAYLGRPTGAYSAESPVQLRVINAAGGRATVLTGFGFGPPAWGGAD